MKVRSRSELPIVAFVRNYKLEDAGARCFHFHEESQSLVRLHGNYAPRIDGVADAQLFRMSAFASEAGPADEPVERTPQPPQPARIEKITAVAKVANNAPQ